MNNYWMGLHGQYEVPDAIVWLAREANKRIGAPLDYGHNGQTARAFLDSPGMKVFAEWGAWRDRQPA